MDEREKPLSPVLFSGTDDKLTTAAVLAVGRATTIRFDYVHPARSPRPARVWHWGKALFNKAYWHTVPQGRLP